MSRKEFVIVADPEIADLIPGYLAKRRDDLPRMKALFEARDLAGLRDLAHRIHGSAGGYGFGDLTVIARDIEYAARDGKADDVRRSLDLLEEYLRLVQVTYD